MINLKVFFIIFSCCIANILYGQPNETFKFTYVDFCDTVNPDYRNYGVIINTGGTSLFYSSPYDFSSAGMKMVDSTQSNKRYVYYSSEDTLRRYIYKNVARSELVFETDYSLALKEKKIYSDTLHPFNWQVHNEKRKIDSFLCTKATVFFRGRYYTAWFDDKIPISNGPWKFGGLPGLIVEIQDNEKRVFWRLQKIERTNEILIKPPVPFDGNYNSFMRDMREAYLKRKKVIESHGSVSDPSCKTCTGSTTYKINLIEKFINE
jgi:GLPGLI family protein